jgi:hypothetical protein
MAINFETFGPFPLKRDGNYVSPDTLADFWDEISEKIPGLEDAIGIYIVSIRHGAVSKPWYVGKTEKGFRRRLKQHIAGYKLFAGLAGIAPKGNVEIYFLARMSSNKTNFKSPSKNEIRSIGKLEELLIGSCLGKNERLLNVQKMSRYRDLYVPGFAKERAGRPTESAIALRKMLG